MVKKGRDSSLPPPCKTHQAKGLKLIYRTFVMTFWKVSYLLLMIFGFSSESSAQKPEADTLPLNEMTWTEGWWIPFDKQTGTADSVCATKVHVFDPNDGLFPCEINDSAFILKGLDTDGKGTFYIAGGNPIRLACYRDGKHIWSREISRDTDCNQAIFRLVGDSIYFVEESQRRMLRIHKNGTGHIDSWNLPIPKGEEFRRSDNYHTDSFFIITTFASERYNSEVAPIDADKEFSLNRAISIPYYYRGYKFAYPAVLIKTAKKSRELSSLNPSVQENLTEGVEDWRGKHGKWHVYTSNSFYGDPTINLVADTTETLWCIYIYRLKDLPTISTSTGIFDNTPSSSRNIELFRNDKVFFSGYDKKKKQFQIHEFDVDSLTRIKPYRHY